MVRLVYLAQLSGLQLITVFPLWLKMTKCYKYSMVDRQKVIACHLPPILHMKMGISNLEDNLNLTVNLVSIICETHGYVVHIEMLMTLAKVRILSAAFIICFLITKVLLINFIITMSHATSTTFATLHCTLLLDFMLHPASLILYYTILSLITIVTAITTQSFMDCYCYNLLFRNRYDLIIIIMDSFSFQHSFVHFLHHFLLSSRIATFHAIYR